MPTSGIRGRAGRLLPAFPRGRRDFACQVVIWLGFAIGYELVRALASPGPVAAVHNATHIVDVERRLGGLYELDVQRWTLEAGTALLRLLDWTYWLSQFAVLSAVLLWVYFRRNSVYLRLRNTLFAVNTLALIAYAAIPTAPPRLVPGYGFVDTVSRSTVTFNSGAVKLLANQYAAMPSLHTADALVIAVVLASVMKTRALRPLVFLWPVWVAFTLLATGNHFLLDIVAGAALGGLGLAAGSIRIHGHRALGPPLSGPAGQ